MNRCVRLAAARAYGFTRVRPVSLSGVACYIIYSPDQSMRGVVAGRARLPFYTTLNASTPGLGSSSGSASLWPRPSTP